MTDFASLSVGSAQSFSVNHNAAADTRAERDANRIAAILRRSEPVFADRGGVGIVFENGLHAKRVGERGNHLKII